MSVGAAGAERQIQNVAAGVLTATSTDAVNGSQLYAAATATNTAATGAANGLGGGAAWNAATGSWTGPTYNVQGNSYNNVGDALGAVNNNITNINNNINNLATATAGGLNSAYQQIQGNQREARQGIAMAAAIAQAPMPSAPGKTSWKFNNAIYKNYGATSIAVSHRLPTQVPMAVTAGVAIGMRNSALVTGGLQGEF